MVKLPGNYYDITIQSLMDALRIMNGRKGF
jgi:hypothetical protein